MPTGSLGKRTRRGLVGEELARGSGLSAEVNTPGLALRPSGRPRLENADSGPSSDRLSGVNTPGPALRPSGRPRSENANSGPSSAGGNTSAIAPRPSGRPRGRVANPSPSVHNADVRGSVTGSVVYTAIPGSNVQAPRYASPYPMPVGSMAIRGYGLNRPSVGFAAGYGTALDAYNGLPNTVLSYMPAVSSGLLNIASDASGSSSPGSLQHPHTVYAPPGNRGTSVVPPAVFVGECNIRAGGAAPVPQPPRQRRTKKWERGAPPPPMEPSMLPSPRRCPHCDAKLFAYEPDGFCCSEGCVVLAPHDIPNSLAELLLSDNVTSEDFRNNIRAYNCLFSFTSMGVKADPDTKNKSKGIYTFRVQGQIYHYINDIDPGQQPPRYLQVYFYDPAFQLQSPLKAFENLDPAVISCLADILEANPYNQSFQSISASPEFADCDVRIKCDPGLDQRTQNLPTSDQVAAIWIDDESRAGKYVRDIRVRHKGGEAKSIQYHLGCFDPLQYPIMFPRGQPGWHPRIYKKPPKKKPRKGPSDAESDSATVSCRQYYCYRLQMRDIRRSSMLFFGRLLQQYMVDMYVKHETSRLDYVRQHQDTIRAEIYQGILDSITAGEMNPNNVGRQVVLPPSFVGGPRDMKRRYQDAMALVRKYGKPDYLVTMTCNPNWAEIRAELLPFEQPQNRPDLVARIFRAKTVEFKRDLIDREILGPIAAYTYVIEYQKRGLPHVHFLLILKKFAKLMSPDRIDKYISAEIPDPHANPHLHNEVKKHMMHGPCGEFNRQCPCMRPKTGCKNKYPREFSDVTRTGDDAFAVYRRQRNGRTVEVRGQTLDNRWVVPYNPYLLAKYDCHINVEICSTIKAVKYLYKYIYKGHDRVVFQVISEQKGCIDEIKAFQSARWISPPEAAWRIFKFPLNEMYPHVTVLQLHLPGMQSIAFNKYTKLAYIATDKKYKKTMLTEYFETNKRDPEARRWLYSEFPEHYVWNSTKSEWTPRKRGDAIGRIVAANPAEGERFFLRILLMHVRGAESYEHLRTVSSHVCETYRDACEKLGLLEKDTASEDCLEEATTFQMPHTLRRLFATILVFCQPSNPRQLWERFYAKLSEDYRRGEANSEGQVLSRTLRHVNMVLESMGRQLRDYNLPMDINGSDEVAPLNREIDEELAIPIPPEDIAASKQLNEDQQTAYDVIIDHVLRKKGACFFVDGPGGTGKTFLYRAILARIRGMGYIALATASTGIAASNLPGGRTAYSRFKLPLDTKEKSCCNIGKRTALAELIRQSSVIIWDEVTMAKKQNIEAFESMLRDICSSNELFGGKVVVFGGDFRQVLPVTVRATKEECICNSIVASHLWPHMRILRLTANMRAIHDPSFAEFLLSVGDGSLQENDESLLKLPQSMVVPFVNERASINAFIDYVYPNFESDCLKSDYLVYRAILTPRNDCVDLLNQILLGRFPGNTHVYTSFDHCLPGSRDNHSLEFLHTLTPNGLPPHELRLKRGCPVMLLRNLDPSAGLSNGIKLICKNLLTNVIHAEIAIGHNKGKDVFIPRIPLRPSETDNYPVEFERKQFPVRPCFAMTINKSQGQTLQYVGIYLPQPVFSHGQLYVALSRATLSASVKILIHPLDNIQTVDSTQNVVYKHLLRRASGQL